jgi:endonuclease/exonuclease/phosphatase family metal-dependent hydrolase
MTFNIRLDTPVDSMNNWKYRRENAARMIRFYDADLLGTQEVLHNQLQDLLALLPEYGFAGVGRKDGKYEGEYSALFYRKSRFELLKTGNFWLSQTPEVPGSMGWDAACERMVTWGIFKDRETGKKFAAFNTHFDHKGKLARLNSALLLKERTGQIAGNLPVILTGDFNTTEGSEPIQALLEGGKLKDTRRSAALCMDLNGLFTDSAKCLSLRGRGLNSYSSFHTKGQCLCITSLKYAIHLSANTIQFLQRLFLSLRTVKSRFQEAVLLDPAENGKDKSADRSSKLPKSSRIPKVYNGPQQSHDANRIVSYAVAANHAPCLEPFSWAEPLLKRRKPEGTQKLGHRHHKNVDIW